MQDQKKISGKDNPPTEKTSDPNFASEEIKKTSTDKTDQQEEDRFEADLDDKRPSGDGGPEEEF